MNDGTSSFSTTTPVASAQSPTGVVSFPHKELSDVRQRFSLQDFRSASSDRCLFWHPEKGVMDWTPELWGNAVIGEIGEAANQLKKLLDGQRNSRIETDHLIWELCDIFIYADIMAARLSAFSGPRDPRKTPAVLGTTFMMTGVMLLFESSYFIGFPDYRSFLPRVFRRMNALVDKAIEEDDVTPVYMVMGMVLRCLDALVPNPDAYIAHVFNTKSEQIKSPIRIKLTNTASAPKTGIDIKDITASSPPFIDPRPVPVTAPDQVGATYNPDKPNA